MKTPVGGVIAVTAAVVLSTALRAETPAPDVKATFVELNAPEARPYRDTGDRAIDRLAMTMITDVNNAVVRNGAVAAVDQCHLKDIPMKDGTVGGMPRIKAVKLTSLKVRNPANAPDAAEQLALGRMKEDLEAGLAPSVLVQRVTLAGGGTEWRVYKPLANIRQCANCHANPGDMPEDLRTKLAQKYPSDQATGYTLGDWRGLMRVTVSDPPPPPAPPAPVKQEPTRRGRRG